MGYLQATGQLEPETGPGERASMPCIAAHLAVMQKADLSPCPVAGRMQQLDNALRAIAPNGDWSKIMRVSARIPGPTGGIWYDTAIRGRPTRDDGLLRNPTYVGRLVWNRMASSKHSTDGSRVRRANAPEARVEHLVPEMAIVDAAVWQAVQGRLQREAAPAKFGHADVASASRPSGRFWERRRPCHLLSGKVICGVCGRGFDPVGKHYLACRAASTSACTNPVRPNRPALEARVVTALAHQLMQPDLAAEFASAFSETWKHLTAEAAARTGQQRLELQQVERKIANLVDALADGLRSPDIRQRMTDLERRRAELVEAGKTPLNVMPMIPPNLAEVYRERLAGLQQALAGPDNTEAREAARALIDKIIITPPNTPGDPPEIELVGNLAAMMRACGVQSRNKESTALTEHVLCMF